MVIQHNIAAINSHRNLGINNSQTNKNLEKLSSGFRINRAGDDAAGLAISEKMRGQIRGLAMAEQNTSNGISLIQTAEGGLNETHAILQRMRELAVQSSNGTYQQEDREQIALEVEALKGEIDRIASATHYNKINLLDGTTGGTELSATAATATTTITNTFDKTSTSAALGAATLAIDATALADMGISGKGMMDGKLVLSDTTGSITFALQVGDKTYALKATSTAGTYEMETENGGKITLVGGTNCVTANLNAGVVSGLQLNTAGAIAATAVGTLAAGGMVATGTNELVFQIGANGTADQQVGLHVNNMSTANIGGDKGLVCDIDVVTRENANAAIAVIDQATNMVSSQRAELGALQNRLEHTLNNLGVTKENLTAAESTIRDVDMAKEMMEFTKNSILVQASQAMLAQANSLPQGVLSLLR